MFLRSILPALLPVCFLIFLISLRHTSADPPPRCDDAEAIPVTSTRTLNAHLRTLVSHSTYFSVFSVALDKSCPFWEDDAPQCAIRECTVEDCPETEVPPAWLCEKEHQLNDVDRSLSGLAALVGPPIWQADDAAAWTVSDDRNRRVFVDLRNNPEQYTGYAGDGSARIWQAVYDENCFTFSDKCRSGICENDACKEERVLYRLISGLHASISMHIARRYPHNGIWGPNLNIYKQRLRAYPERIANLNVAYAVVMRAVSKAASALHPSSYSYITGNEHNDRFTNTALTTLFRLPLLQPGCEQKVFDESDMFIQKDENMLPEFRTAFRNISMIMDCVGCEKCRLWGKLQFLGLGTALRILFEDDMPQLERNDVIALLNLLYKLSTSVVSVGDMEEMLRQGARMRAKAAGAVTGLIILLLAYFYSNDKRKQSTEAKEAAKKAAEIQCTIASATAATADDDTSSVLSTLTSDAKENDSQNSHNRASTNEDDSSNGQTPIRRSSRLRKRSQANTS